MEKTTENKKRAWVRRRTPELLKRFETLLAKGKTCEECSKILHQPAQYLSNLKRRTLKIDDGIRGTYATWNTSQLRAVADLRRRGVRIKDIASKFGVSYGSVYYALERNGMVHKK